jgi:hypothetical protein
MTRQKSKNLEVARRDRPDSINYRFEGVDPTSSSHRDAYFVCFFVLLTILVRFVP